MTESLMTRKVPIPAIICSMRYYFDGSGKSVYLKNREKVQIPLLKNLENVQILPRKKLENVQIWC